MQKIKISQQLYIPNIFPNANAKAVIIETIKIFRNLILRQEMELNHGHIKFIILIYYFRFYIKF